MLGGERGPLRGEGAGGGTQDDEAAQSRKMAPDGEGKRESDHVTVGKKEAVSLR